MSSAPENVRLRPPAATEGRPLPGTARRAAPVPAAVADKHYRSLLKAISWRATGTLDTILVSFVVTGQIKLAISIGFVELFTKIILFYFHERIWNRIQLGRVAPREDYSI